VRTDVLVVGAGPTGLMLAAQLARRGVRPLVVEKNAGPSVRTKALGVQARTMEIYSRLGIAARALELGKRATGASMWALGRRKARVPLGDIGRDLSPFPFLLILGQDDNERLLGDKLRELGTDVRWSTELVGLEQRAGGVLARLRLPDGSTQEAQASWVAGCDGAHSAVRRLNGVDFVGAPYEHVFYVADVRMRGAMAPGELNVYLWKRGFHLFFPMRGDDHWRVAGILPRAIRDRDDLRFDDVLPSVREEAGESLRLDECTWFSTYRIHHRRAARFRAGRCFLLGDAAHVHSPVGAQGMNTGLQDAYNLAWKLALVVTGRAGDRLLETYAAEREPVADRLLSSTDRAFSLIVQERWPTGAVRTHVLPRFLALAMSRGASRRLAFRTISQIGIRYPASPLSRGGVAGPRGRPRPGDRFPWLRLRFAPGGPAEGLFERMDDTRFQLILVGQEAPALPPAAAGLVVTHAVPAGPDNDRELRRAGIPTPSFWLLRPDGHVGLAGEQVQGDAIAGYLAEAVGHRPGSPGPERLAEPREQPVRRS
jgi:2-polyprenyl-6-methoxyphenol hydroxylase-like FAD-dependent oxidoreductase